MNTIHIGNVIATDDAGNTYVKDISVRRGRDGWIFGFGFPCEYYMDSLETIMPLHGKLCIDASGYRHKRYPVYINSDDLNAAYEIAKEKVKSNGRQK